MIDLHYWTTPNGHKITIFLEETGLKYRIVPVNIGIGEQFRPEFLAISPNNRMPAIIDHEPGGGGKPISVFESGASISPKRAENSCQAISAVGTRSSSGCSGRWADWALWQGRTLISANTRRTRSLTRSNDM